MHSKDINPLVSWWMTPKLPYEDIYELPLLKKKGVINKSLHLVSSWLVHPIKRRLAKYYLRELQKKGLIVIGITGSAGKSTTAKMVGAVLSKKGKTVVTPAGIDPVYNIPNTILKCNSETKYLVLEMSVEFPGEMDYYLWLAKPDAAVITNIYASHLEFFKDLGGVLKEKGKLAKAVGSGDAVFLNYDDPKLKKFATTLNSKIIWFRTKGDPVNDNWEAAKTVGRFFGVGKVHLANIEENFAHPDHRMQMIRNGSVTILDDTYNSNPSAAIAVLKHFSKIAKGYKIVVLGDMLQMGDYNTEAHKLVGKEVAKYKFDVFVGVGKSSEIMTKTVSDNSKGTKVIWAKNCDEAIPVVKNMVRPGSFVLVKGSRSIGLDKLVDSIS